MNTNNHHNISKEDLYKKYLNTVSGINFTLREIDIMSCVLHNRGNKKTADILSISYRTVESHIRNIIGKINKASRDDIIDFIEKSHVLAHFNTYYTWMLTRYYFKNCLLKIAKINQQELHYAITDKMTSTEDQSYSVLTEKLQKMQKDLQLANVMLSVKKSGNNHYLTLETEGIKVSNKKIVIIFDNTDSKDASGVIYVDFRGNYYLSILNLLETIIPKAEVKKTIQEFKDQYFNLQNISGVTSAKKNIEKHTTERIFSKYLLIILVVLAIILAALFLFQRHDKTVSGQEMHNSRPALSVDKNLHTWDLPYFNLEHYVNRTETIKTITSKFIKKENIENPTIFIGLYGLAGIGKTTLAKYLAHYPVKKYNFTGWFNAENDALLKNSYMSLGEKHHLFSQDTPEHQKIDKTKEWLNSQENLLIVYDNVPDATILKKYLPDHGHIIITSRNYKLPGALALESMTQKESIALLSGLIPQKTMENQKAVDTLIETMGHLPLALSQAGAYISDNEMTITAYLSLYERARKKLLSDKILPAMEDHEPIYITWNLTIQALRQKPDQEKIFQLLGFIGQCYREKIPKKLLSQYLCGATEGEAMVELNTILKLLKEYSLINVYADTISIHPLLHSFLQDFFADKAQETKIIKQAIDVTLALQHSKEIKDKDTLYKMMLPHISIILDKGKKLLKEHEYIKFMVLLGKIHYRLGNDFVSRQIFKQALNIQINHSGNDFIDNNIIFYYLGTIEMMLGNYDESRKHLIHSLEIQKKHYGTDNTKSNSVLLELARLEQAMGNYNTSKAILEKTLRIHKQYSKQDITIDTDENYRNIMFWIAVNDLLLENYTESQKLLTELLRSKIKNHGLKHIATASVLYYLGKVELEIGHYQESINLLQRTLIIENQYYGIGHPETSFTLHFFGNAKFMAGYYKEGIQLLEQALMMQESYFGANYTKLAETLHTLGKLHMKLSNDQESQKLLERALKIQEQNFGLHNNKVADILCSLGALHIKIGNSQEAKKLLERALQIHKQYFGLDHSKVKRTMDALHTIGTVNQAA